MFGFQSREEKQFAHKITVRGALRDLDRKEREADGYVDKFVGLARQAREHGDDKGYEASFKAVDTSLKFKKVILRQKILIETGRLALDQAQSMAGFEKATSSCATALNDIFRTLNFPRMAARSQRVQAQSEGMQERMDLMMEEMLGNLSGTDVVSTSKAEIESLINGADKATSLGHLNDLKGLRASIAEMRDSIRAKG